MILCSCVIVTVLSGEKGQISYLSCQRVIKIYENKFGDRMIKQLLDSVFAKYCDLSVSLADH